MRTEKIVAAMRCSYQMPGPELDCRTCPYHMEEGDDYAGCDCGCILADAVDRLEELVERCARYAEEIAVLQEKQRWVDVREKLPERDGHYLCRYVFGSGGKGFYGTLDYYAIDPRPHFQHEGAHGMAVTHWMDIPEVECDNSTAVRKWTGEIVDG